MKRNVIRPLLTHRAWVFLIIPVIALGWLLYDDPNQGEQLGIQVQGLLSLIVLAPMAYIIVKGLIHGDSKKAWVLGEQGSIAGALLYGFIGLIRVITFFGLLAFAGRILAEPLPPGAVQYLPTLQSEIAARWPALPMPSVLAAQIEQESLWRINATLKTSRELGVGLGQFTKACRADGSVRFDALADTRALDAGLVGWTWANAYNPVYQLRGVVVKNRATFNRLRRLVDDDTAALAMTDAAYNCGEGCVYARRRLCAKTEGCDPDQWFGHVERYSAQSKTKWHGYGQSAHDITNTHVRNVMVVRRPKYTAWFGEGPA